MANPKLSLVWQRGKEMRHLFFVFVFVLFVPFGAQSVQAQTQTSAQEGQCAVSQAGCAVYRCSNGIILRGASATSVTARANACNRVLGGRGALKRLPENCVELEVGDIPAGTTKLLAVVHNPATFRMTCGVELCQDCTPTHSKYGPADLAAELTVRNGVVKIPAAWLPGATYAWLCVPGQRLSVGLSKGNIRYLLKHGRTPVGDPLEWGPSQFIPAAPLLAG